MRLKHGEKGSSPEQFPEKQALGQVYTADSSLPTRPVLGGAQKWFHVQSSICNTRDWIHPGGAGHPGVVLELVVQGVPQQVEPVQDDGGGPQALHHQHGNAATSSTPVGYLSWTGFYDGAKYTQLRRECEESRGCTSVAWQGVCLSVRLLLSWTSALYTPQYAMLLAAVEI